MIKEDVLNKTYERIYKQCIEVNISKVTCIFQSNYSMWNDLGNYFLSKGIEFKCIPFENNEETFDYWAEKILKDESDSNQSNLTIFGLPINSEDKELNIKFHYFLSEYFNKGSYVILFDWLTFENWDFDNYFQKMQLEALNIDYEKLREINLKTKLQLLKTNRYKVTCQNGTDLIFERGNREIFEENCHLGEEKVYQIPGGEVFFAPIENSINGCIAYKYKGDIQKIKVENGIAFTNGLFIDEINKMQVAEFGVGTNYKSKPISAVSLGEKAKGTFHIGLGDNQSFGGTSKSHFHFDILLKSPKIEFL